MLSNIFQTEANSQAFWVWCLSRLRISYSDSRYVLCIIVGFFHIIWTIFVGRGDHKQRAHTHLSFRDCKLNANDAFLDIHCPANRSYLRRLKQRRNSFATGNSFPQRHGNATSLQRTCTSWMLRKKTLHNYVQVLPGNPSYNDATRFQR